MRGTFIEAMKEPFWSLSVVETMRALETSVGGLGDGEVSARQKRFGANTIRERVRSSRVSLFLRQFANPLILMLIAAWVVTVFLGEWTEAGVIAAAVLLNAALGFYQEYRAEYALAALRSYVRVRARVRRSGAERESDASELVPGDIIRVSQGDRVPADVRLFFVNTLEADESVLTGESLPVEKSTDVLPAHTALGDRTNMLFSGTLVVGGVGDGVVTAIGSHTEFGKIAHAVAAKEKETTPLQRAVARFAAGAGIVFLLLVLLLFYAGIASGYGLFDMFLIAVAVAVSAVPEGLPVALTVIMAIGVERMARRKGVVRRLLAAETLGSTSIILTDKTGTLTQARLELQTVRAFPNDDRESRRLVLQDGAANTDVVIENPDAPRDEWRVSGRAIDRAVYRAALREGVFLGTGGRAHAKDFLPFTSDAKLSAVLYRDGNSVRLSLLGAPERVLAHSSLSSDGRASVLAEVAAYASRGERVLAVAGRTLGASEQVLLSKRQFGSLAFEGLLSFHDPLRPGVRETIRHIENAGIRTVIVTGDHQNTAEAVARDVGLMDGAGAVLTSDDLAYLTPEELYARAGDVSVYARVTPQDKLALVELYRARGEVVAVTGDGVNDAPALHAADIGVAMGSGTDVAKSAADLVILDDDFKTIVAAIEEGRRVLDNIRKVIVYLLSDALDELLLIGGALLMGLALPLNALQILFVNFFSDSFPAIALAFEKGVDGLGSTPKKLHPALFDRQMRFLILVIGVATSASLFLLYFLLLSSGFSQELVQTFIFATFATYSLLLAFSVRSLEKSIFAYNPFANIYLTLGVAIGVALTLLVVYVPVLQMIFRTVPLPPFWLGGVVAMGLFNIAAVEFGKWLFRKNIL